MENLTHCLAGIAIARTRPFREIPRASLVAVVAANLADVDSLWYLAGPDAGLLHRRGSTHGVVAMALLPALLALVVAAALRAGRRDKAGFGRVLLFCALGIWSHPLLDLMNVYGVRLLMPLDARWFYGDALFIVDPWLWLTLGLPLAASRPPGRAVAACWGIVALLAALLVAVAPVFPAGAKLLWMVMAAAGGVALSRSRVLRAPATAAALGCLHVIAMVLLGGAVRLDVARTLAGTGPGETLVAPEAGDPLAWRVVASYPDRYDLGSYRLLRNPRLAFAQRILREAPGPAVHAALEAPCVRGFAGWVRFPWYEVQPSGAGTRVHMRDARFLPGRTGGFGAARVDLDAQLRPVDCAP